MGEQALLTEPVAVVLCMELLCSCCCCSIMWWLLLRECMLALAVCCDDALNCFVCKSSSRTSRHTVVAWCTNTF